MTAFWNIAPCIHEAHRRFRGGTASIIRAMMGAIRTSETSVYVETTWRCNTEGCNRKVTFHANSEVHV
jgi:hypothetical protein